MSSPPNCWQSLGRAKRERPKEEEGESVRSSVESMYLICRGKCQRKRHQRWWWFHHIHSIDVLFVCLIAQRGVLFISARVFFLVWCHPWMDDGTDGWMDGKLYEKQPRRLLLYVIIMSWRIFLFLLTDCFLKIRYIFAWWNIWVSIILLLPS
jgi:hypothetical protein